MQIQAPKNYQGTKYVRQGCSMFYPDLPDQWFNLDEFPVPVPKDTARKKANQTYRAHAPTRKLIGVPSRKVKVKACGTASRNTQAKGKAAKRAAMKVDEMFCTAATSVEFADYSTDKFFAKSDVEDKSEE